MKCKSCDGQGSIYRTSWDDEQPELIPCSDCEGTGVIEGREEGEEDGPLTKWSVGLGLLTILYLIFS